MSFQEPESRPSTSARSIRTLEERLQESLQRIEDATKRGVDTIMLPAESQVSPAATADATKMEIPAEPSHSEMSETVTESATEESSGRITRSEELKEKASSLEDKIISKAEAEEKSQADQKKDSSQEKKAEEKPKQEVTKTQEEQKEDAGTEKKAEDKPKEEVVKTQEEEKKDAGKEEKAEEKSEHAVTLEHAQKVADEVVSEVLTSALSSVPSTALAKDVEDKAATPSGATAASSEDKTEDIKPSTTDSPSES